MQAENSAVSTNNSLSGRRVPHILGFYVAASWGVIQFVEWIVHRYGLSPYLPDFSLVILFSLLPSVAIVAYFHGAPGRDKWTRVEKVSVPLNILLTGILLVVFFGGKDLGAATKTLVIKNEDGLAEKRVIPKSEFRKKIALYGLKNKTGDNTLDWMETALPLALHVDLMQDPFLDNESLILGNHLSEQVKKSGFPNATGMPVALMRKITEDLHYDYFLSGNFSKNKDQYSLVSELYEVSSGKKIASNRYLLMDPVDWVDKASIQIKTDLKIPAFRNQSVQDLPINELLTTKSKTLKAFILGMQAQKIDNDYSLATTQLEQSTKLDPTFALGHLFLSLFYANTNQSKKSIQAIRKAMKLQYKMPEKLQFLAKDIFYIMTGEANKRENLLKMQTELYPDDIDAKVTLADAYYSMQEFSKAIEVYKQIQKIAPQPEIHFDSIAYNYLRINDFSMALEYMQKYTKAFPKEAKSFNSLAYVYWLLGNTKLARDNYEKSLFIDPDNLQAKLKLANMDILDGNYALALASYHKILLQTHDANERKNIHIELRNLYKQKGQPKQALEQTKKAFKELKSYMPPLSIAIQAIFYIENFMAAGHKEEAFSLLSKTDNALEAPFDKLIAIGYIIAYTSLGELEKASALLPELEETIKNNASILTDMNTVPLLLRARIEEAKNNFELAAKIYIDFAKLKTIDIARFNAIGRCYRKAKNYDLALTYLEKQFKLTPFSSKTNHELGLVYRDLDNLEKAKFHLSRAANIWEEAESGFQLANDNREALAELTK